MTLITIIRKMGVGYHQSIKGYLAASPYVNDIRWYPILGPPDESCHDLDKIWEMYRDAD